MSDITSWWGAVTGSIGAGLGIFNAYKAQQEKKPLLNVELYPYTTDIQSPNFTNPPVAYCWRLTNLSAQAIVLSSAFMIVLPRTKALTIVRIDTITNLPYIIEPKQVCSIELNAIAMGHILHKAIYELQTLEGGVLHAEVSKSIVKFVALDTLDNQYSLGYVTDREILSEMHRQIKGNPNPQVKTMLLQHPERFSWSNVISSLGLDRHEIQVF